MTPPDAPKAEEMTSARGSQPAALSCAGETQDARAEQNLTVIAKRSDFLKAAKARRQGTSSFLLQARKRRDDEGVSGIRIGYTCSKKVGNAIKRNHAKRRLREIARLVLPQLGQPGWDYVLIGKAKDTSARPFDLLIKDLKYALKKVHSDTPRKR